MNILEMKAKEARLKAILKAIQDAPRRRGTRPTMLATALREKFSQVDDITWNTDLDALVQAKLIVPLGEARKREWGLPEKKR